MNKRRSADRHRDLQGHSEQRGKEIVGDWRTNKTKNDRHNKTERKKQKKRDRISSILYILSMFSLFVSLGVLLQGLTAQEVEHGNHNLQINKSAALQTLAVIACSGED